jgi:hypothetical protein
VRVAYRTLATKPLGERLPVEVRVTRGVGEATHVDQAANSVRSEKAQELLEGPRRMPDGEDEVRVSIGIRHQRMRLGSVPTKVTKAVRGPILAHPHARGTGDRWA